MERIDEFCRANRISKSASSDSYYFELNGRNYRVSNHTIAASDRGMYSFTGEQVRDSYHRDSEDLICITAGKTRIIEIYNALKAGKELDGRGFVKAVK